MVRIVICFDIVMVFVHFNCGFNFSLVSNLIKLPRRPGTQQFIIGTVVFVEETIVINIYFCDQTAAY